MERMNEYRMARRVLMVEVSGGWVQGRPTLGLEQHTAGMTVEAARQCVKFRKDWRALVDM